MSSDISSSEDDKLKNNGFHLIENKHISIDVTMLYEVSGGDKNFIYSAVCAFLKNMPDTINKIEECINLADWDNVFKLSHLVKSSLSVIKIDEMFDWMTQIEANAKDRSNLNNMSDMIKKIREKYNLSEVLLNESILTRKILHFNNL